MNPSMEESIESLEQRPFWYSERILFFGSLVVFFISAVGLLFTEQTNTQITQKSFLDFLFNSVSIGTLTGLFRGDSGFYTFGGQLILLLNMIVSGIIVSVIGILLILFVRYGFDRKNTLQQELKRMGVDSTNVILFIFIDFLIIWTIGTVLFTLNGTKTLWESIFNAASHILNNGVTAFPNNMIPYRENYGMILSGAFLITIGGWGISIRGAFYKWFLSAIGMKKLAKLIPDSIIATKNFIIAIVSITLILQIIGTVSIYAFESINPQTLKNTEALLNSYYFSVSARTAGFTTLVDLSQMSDKSQLVLMALMFIGASSSSFAGGVLKLTAFLYMFLYIISKFRGQHEIHTRHWNIHMSKKTVIESNFRIIGFTILTMTIIFITFFLEPDISGVWLLFEGISAVSNTGLTLGATVLLKDPGLIAMIILMIIGKVGFISTTISFFPKLQKLLEEIPADHDELPVD